jgi:MtN3 and saliva related transmembrane protein
VSLGVSVGDVCGYVGAACTTLSFVPQVLRVWRRRSADDISAGMYVLFITGLLGWLAYGAMIGSWPILIANTVTVGLAGAVLWMKLAFASRPRDGAGGA